MFTGIVSDVATIAKIDEHTDGRKMRIQTVYDTDDFEHWRINCPQWYLPNRRRKAKC